MKKTRLTKSNPFKNFYINSNINYYIYRNVLFNIFMYKRLLWIYKSFFGE